jgi:hypothetical protein
MYVINKRFSIVNHIDGAMVSVVALTAVDIAFEPRSGLNQSFTKSVFAIFPLSTQLLGTRAKTG